MDIGLTAYKIASKYINQNVDMNESIAKYATDNSLNIEQTKRLIEESNKTCYLQKFASTGEQIFDVAKYDIVKEKINSIDKIEKTASIKFKEINMEKIAEENYEVHYQLAINKCRKEIGSELVKIANLEHELNLKVPGYDNELNVNNIHPSVVPEFEKISNELKSHYQIVERNEKRINYLMEKHAGIISGTAGAVLKGSAKVAGKTAGFVAEAPLKRGLMPVSFKEGMNKVKVNEDNVLINKEAAINMGTIGKGLEELIERVAVPALAFGAVGLGVGAAKGAGGIVSRMMQDRQLNESFNTIEQHNSDIRQIPNARAYFDVIARHSPSLALDPMVAPQLIRQFDTFGGVDVNTVGKLREIQDRGSRSSSASSIDTATSTLKGITSLIPKK